MILPDTSAWVEFLRATESPVDLRLTALLERRHVAVTDPVMMEILAGARSDAELHKLRQLLAGCEYVGVSAPADFEDAAAIQRRCRAGGASVRRIVDCLIAAVAVRADLEILHRDRDFDTIAAHSPLRLSDP